MFDYGDNIRIKTEAPDKFKPGEFGSIFGITIINNEELSRDYGINLGVKCYDIELIDGSDILVPGEYLELDIE